MAFLLGGANSASGGYNIDNSLRAGDSTNYKLVWTPSSNGSERIFTFSAWVKRGSITDNREILFRPNSGTVWADLEFQTNDSIICMTNGSSGAGVVTNRLFRDVSAWYHVVCAIDTTQGTPANRVKIYVNGVLETSFSESNYMAQNADTENNQTDSYTQIFGDSYGNHLHMADVYWIDGTQYAASDFGETNDNGVWIPKAASVTFGTNGFKLQFKQTGTGADSSGIGADTSGNDNHLAVTGFDAQDQTTDTPTNNFATLNPLSKFASPVVTEGNLEYDSNASGGSSMVSTIAPSNGKWYVEVKAVTSTIHIGVSEVGLINFNEKGQGASRPNINYAYGGGISIDEGTADSETSFTTNDIIGIALNLDDGEVIFYKNGTAQNSGTAYNLHTNTTHGNTGFSVQTATGSGNTKASFNFGNPAFAISSGNADANGYGNFEYAVPSGYYALCTKNLAEFG